MNNPGGIHTTMLPFMIAHRKCRQKSQRSGQLHSPKCEWLIFVDHLSEINPYSIATKIEQGQIHFEVVLNTVYVCTNITNSCNPNILDSF